MRLFILTSYFINSFQVENTLQNNGTNILCDIKSNLTETIRKF